MGGGIAAGRIGGGRRIGIGVGGLGTGEGWMEKMKKYRR